MSVITISRQLGSWGTEIARGVAEKLNYEYADKELVGKMMAGYGIAAPEMDKFDEKKPPFWDSLSFQRRNFLHFIEMAIYELARKNGVVIVGRGGQVLLKDLPGTLHVRIFSPLHVRLRRLIESEGVDERHAMLIIRQGDHDSSGYIKSFFNQEWDDPSLYHLLMNTEKLSVKAGVDLITAAVQFPEIQAGAEKAAEKLADLGLVQEIEAKLLEMSQYQGRRVEVSAENGIVFLRGEVISALNKDHCEQLAAGLKGVKRVENELIVVPPYRHGLWDG
jgi:cytidylate kinase